MNLRELLNDWEDQDISAYYLACCLGLAQYESTFKEFNKIKHVFWTGNPTSNFLSAMLSEMAEKQILEFDDEEGKYRWNQSFKP